MNYPECDYKSVLELFQNNSDCQVLKNDLIDRDIKATRISLEINGRCVTLAEVACRLLYLTHTVINGLDTTALVISFYCVIILVQLF